MGELTSLTQADCKDIFDSFSSMYGTIFCLGLNLPKLIDKEFEGDDGQRYYDHISHFSNCHPILIGFMTLLLAGGLSIFLQHKIKQQIIDYQNALEQQKLLIDELYSQLNRVNPQLSESEASQWQIDLTMLANLPTLHKQQYKTLELSIIADSDPAVAQNPESDPRQAKAKVWQSIAGNKKLVLHKKESDRRQARLGQFVEILSNPGKYSLLNTFATNFSLLMSFAVVFLCMNILVAHFVIVVVVAAVFTVLPYILPKIFQWLAHANKSSSGLQSQIVVKRYNKLIQDKHTVDTINQILAHTIRYKDNENELSSENQVSTKDHLTILCTKFALCLFAMLDNIVGVLFGWQTCLFVLHELWSHSHISSHVFNLIFNAIGHGPVCLIIFCTLLFVGIVYGCIKFKNMWDNHTLAQEEKNLLETQGFSCAGKHESNPPLTGFKSYMEFVLFHPMSKIIFDCIKFIGIAKIFFVGSALYFWPWAAIILPPPIFILVVFGGALLYSLISYKLNSVKYQDEKDIMLLRQQLITHVLHSNETAASQEQQQSSAEKSGGDFFWWGIVRDGCNQLSLDHNGSTGQDFAPQC